MSGDNSPVDIEDNPPIYDIAEIRKTCPVFRVLVIGRANAGKTTILQKVCNVDKDTKPVVYDADGRELEDWDVPVPVAEEGSSSTQPTQPKSGPGSKLEKIKNRFQRSSLMRSMTKRLAHPSGSKIGYNTESDAEVSNTDILRPSTQRGRHDIRNQITYPGSHFIFHDSRGIEAGSVDEFKIIHEFVHERASKQSLAEQLHAIWFCVPMDNRRPLVKAELDFFNKGTENVPVVVVFTKYDALLDQVANDLGIIDLTEDKRIAVSEAAEARYQECYNSRVMETAHPPKAVVRLQEMDKAEAHCPELSEQTAAAIDNLSLRQLFISVQQNNIKLCMQLAARVSRQSHPDEAVMIDRIWLHFPHAWGSQTFNKPETWVEEAKQVQKAVDWRRDLGRRDLDWDLDWDWWVNGGWGEDIKELVNMYGNVGKKHQIKEQLAAAAIIIGVDSSTMWKTDNNPWRWSLERYKSTSQVQDYIQDMLAKEFSIYARKEAQAQVILRIASLALDVLKAECDKVLAHEEKEHH